MNTTGFTTASLLSYSNLETFANGYFSGINLNENQTYKLNSKVVTVTVSNRNTSHLKQPITLTLHHLQEVKRKTCSEWESLQEENAAVIASFFLLCGCVLQLNQTSHICVFWDSSVQGGAWSTRGCRVVKSNLKSTVCSCNHLSSFAVLMALYDIEVKTLLCDSPRCKLRSVSAYANVTVFLGFSFSY